MILLLPICIALTSVIFTTFSFISPSKPKLKAPYALIALTLASGTYLVASTGSPILQSCVTGLIYTATMLTGILATRHKLSHPKL